MDKQVFGIFNPRYELVKNIPKILLNKVILPDSENILLKDGKIVRRKMREKDLLNEGVKVQTPDTFPILHYHKFTKRSTGTQYLLAFTKAHIYHWNAATFDLKWTNHNISVNTIAFNDNGANADTITDSGTGFVTAGFVDGDKITVTGDSENNGDYTIDTVVAGTITLIATDVLTTEIAGDSVVIVANCDNWETVSYNDKIIATNAIDKVLVWDTTGNFVALDKHYPSITANDIAFVDGGAGEDTITSVAAGFGDFTAGDEITITGSASNNGDYTIISVVAATINVATGSLTAEGAGATVTIVGTTAHYNGVEYDTCKYLTKCKHLITYENYLILGYTYEDGSWYPQRMRWNDIGDEANWLTGRSSSTEVGKADFIKGFGLYRGHLIVFKETSHFKFWLVASAYTFNGAFISMKIGCRCSGSIVNDNKGRLYWYASDGTIKEMSVGTISQPIQTEIIDKIYQTSVDLIKSEFIDETGEVWWSIPYDNALNNKIVTLKEGEQGERIWGHIDLAIPAFGSYVE